MTEARVATRESFPIPATPCEWESLDFDLSFDAREFDRVQRGFIPEAKDSWFIFYEDPWLYVHRARSGAAFARLRFVQRGGRLVAAEVWLRKGAHIGYQRTWDRSDKIRALQETLALTFGAPFPTPP
jgi:hypothetical protein